MTTHESPSTRRRARLWIAKDHAMRNCTWDRYSSRAHRAKVSQQPPGTAERAREEMEAAWERYTEARNRDSERGMKSRRKRQHKKRVLERARQRRDRFWWEPEGWVCDSYDTHKDRIIRPRLPYRDGYNEDGRWDGPPWPMNPAGVA